MSNPDTCQICTKNEVKYNCPRCNVLYCSLMCYKSPSHTKCSEAFYKECVHQELEIQKQVAEPVDENFRKMMNILQRIENGEEDFDIPDYVEEQDIEAESDESDESEIDSDDDDATNDLAARLNGIDLDDSEAIWNQLTSSEKKKFELLVYSDNLEKLIPKYTPWWEEAFEKKEVAMAGAYTGNSEGNHVSPKILDQIIAFEKISTKPPAECNYYNLINILGSYSQMVRFYNGDHHEDPKESTTYFSRVCGNFKSNTNYISESNAIEEIFHDCNLEGVAVDDQTVFILKRDLTSLLNGPYTNSKTNFYILASLSDLHRLFIAAKKNNCDKSNVKHNSNGDFGKKFIGHISVNSNLITKSKLNIFIKKVEYYLSYVNKFL